MMNLTEEHRGNEEEEVGRGGSNSSSRPPSSNGDPDPNHKSSGVSAAESVRLVDTEKGLRVPCYCEENVWRLVHRKRIGEDGSVDTSSRQQYWVVFVSNPIKNVPMFCQRAASDPMTACCWDYHVILISLDDQTAHVLVWDMDSTLDYPCPLRIYLDKTFPYDWPAPHGPQFRVVRADVYRNTFASDRSHMYKHHRWNAPPPPYDIIQTDTDTHTLPYLLDFVARRQDDTYRRLERSGALGRILMLPQMREHEFVHMS